MWFRPIEGYALNLEVQHYRGQPVLTWFQQAAADDALRNEDVIVNRSYRTVADRSTPATATSPTCTSSSSPRGHAH